MERIKIKSRIEGFMYGLAGGMRLQDLEIDYRSRDFDAPVERVYAAALDEIVSLGYSLHLSPTGHGMLLTDFRQKTKSLPWRSRKTRDRVMLSMSQISPSSTNLVATITIEYLPSPRGDWETMFMNHKMAIAAYRFLLDEIEKRLTLHSN